MKNNTLKYDIAVIGFGKGGKTLALSMAAAGKKTAVIERSDKMYGGTCINAGCIPSKSLVHSAALSPKTESFEEKAEYYKQAIEEKRSLVSALRQKNYQKLNDRENITVITGTASFLDDHHLEIVLPPSKPEEGSQPGRLVIEADHIIINTGAAPFIPPIPGLAGSRQMYVSETLLELDILPEELVIIGGGYIGMEFASMYANFGSRVTILQDGPVFLPREDEEIADAVRKSLAERGVRILLASNILSVEDHCENGKYFSTITLKQESQTLKLRADAILTAAGRRPNIDGLHTEAAGIELTGRGAVKVDEHMRTSVPHIYALGDVTGGLQFTYISLDDYRIAFSDLMGDKSRTSLNRGAIPYSVFLDPPFSRVGLSEREAVEKGYPITVFRLPASAIPKAKVLKKPDGMLKAIVDTDTGLILGAHLFCEESYETINLIKLAMDTRQPYTVLKNMIFTHPTMSEALNDLFS